MPRLNLQRHFNLSRVMPFLNRKIAKFLVFIFLSKFASTKCYETLIFAMLITSKYRLSFISMASLYPFSSYASINMGKKGKFFIKLKFATMNYSFLCGNALAH